MPNHQLMPRPTQAKQSQRPRAHRAGLARAGLGGPLDMPQTTGQKALAAGLTFGPGAVGAVAGYLVAPEGRKYVGASMGTAGGILLGSGAYAFTHDDIWTVINKHFVMPLAGGALVGGGIGYVAAPSSDKEPAYHAGSMAGILAGLITAYLLPAPTIQPPSEGV